MVSRVRSQKPPKIVIVSPPKPLLILALHTTSPKLQIVLGNPVDYRLGEWLLGRELGKYLHTYLSEIMADTPWHSLGAIAVHSGAGSQTGMRIGLTVAITLAQQLGIPMYAIAEADHALQLMAITEQHYNQGIFPQWQTATASLSSCPS